MFDRPVIDAEKLNSLVVLYDMLRGNVLGPVHSMCCRGILINFFESLLLGLPSPRPKTKTTGPLRFFSQPRCPCRGAPCDVALGHGIFPRRGGGSRAPLGEGKATAEGSEKDLVLRGPHTCLFMGRPLALPQGFEGEDDEVEPHWW